MIEDVKFKGKTYMHIDVWDRHYLFTKAQIAQARKKYKEWQDHLYKGSTGSEPPDEWGF